MAPVKLIHPFHLIMKDGDCLTDSLVALRHCFGLKTKYIQIIYTVTICLQNYTCITI